MTRNDDFIGHLDRYVADYEGNTPLPESVRHAIRAQLPLTRQRSAWWPARRTPNMNNIAKLGLATAVVVTALLGYTYFVAPNIGVPEPTASPDASPAASVASALPALSLPSTRGGPPGEYGWEGAEGNSGGMHWVVENVGEVAAMFFAVGPNCLERRTDQHPVAVRVAGLEGISVEPYVPALVFNGVGDEITRAYALDVDGRTLCVFVTWHPTTSDRHRAAAFEILDSLRAELRVRPSGQERIRITFTLRDRWDTG